MMPQLDVDAIELVTQLAEDPSRSLVFERPSNWLTTMRPVPRGRSATR